MGVIVTKPMKHAKCICCGSDKRYMHEFQFFQDIGCKTCVTLCDACVNTMHTIVLEEICDRVEEAQREKHHKSMS